MADGCYIAAGSRAGVFSEGIHRNKHIASRLIIENDSQKRFWDILKLYSGGKRSARTVLANWDYSSMLLLTVPKF